jgi:formylglycine-generating enzyme required for sulfatase activity
MRHWFLTYTSQRRKLRTQVAFAGLAVVIVLGFAAYWNEQPLRQFYHRFTHVRSYVLTAESERMLKPGETFTECATTDGSYSEYCPEMVVIPAGKFIMGSPATEKHRSRIEGPQHEVTITRPLPFPGSR